MMRATFRTWFAHWPGLCAVTCMLSMPHAASASVTATQTLQSKQTLTLKQPGPQFLDLQITQAGTYRIQTTGDSDTYCKLYDRVRGPFLEDDNSGDAKNCRLDVQLEAGTYKLWVRKAKRPIKVQLLPYQEQGAVEDVAPGIWAQDTLKALHYRNFRIKIKRRQRLTLQARGWTVHQCRLFDTQGWSYELSQQTIYSPRRYRKYYRHRRYRHKNNSGVSQCQLSGIIEPGSYVFRVYGQVSPPRPQHPPRAEAPLYFTYGAKKLSFKNWQEVAFHRHQRRRKFWFQLPSTKLPGQKMILVVEAVHHNAYLRASTYLELQQRGWLQPHASNLQSCWMYRNKNQCTLALPVKAGKRYFIRLTGQRALKIRYFAFVSQAEAVLNGTASLFVNSGEKAKFDITLPTNGSYSFSTSPKVKSCFLEYKNRPIHKRIAVVRGLAMSSLPNIAQLPLDRNGQTFWFRVPQKAQVRLETKGNNDTYCQLQTWDGQYLASDDDSGTEKNCLIQRQLPPGVYGLYARIYRGNYSSWTQLAYQMTPEGKPLKAAPTEPGCHFTANLPAGSYRLTLNEATQTQIQKLNISAPHLKKSHPRTKPPMARNKAKRTPDPTLAALAPIVVPKSNTLTTWFSLAKRQKRWLSWELKQPGVYHIQSMGHLRTQCQLNNATGTLFSDSQPTGEHPCQLTHYLPQGHYRVALEALGKSHGIAGLRIQRMARKKLNPLALSQAIFGSIKRGQSAHTIIPIDNETKIRFDGWSPDANIACRVMDIDQWPIFAGDGCRWVSTLQVKTIYRLWIFPKRTSKHTRFRLFASKPNLWTQSFPLPIQRPNRSNPTKHVELLLNQPVSTYISALGWDAYEFTLTKAAKVRVKFSPGLVARLYRGSTFIRQISSKARQEAPTLSLQSGEYRLLLRDQLARTFRPYKLSVDVVSTQPGVMLWIPTPGKVDLLVDSSKRIEISTEGDADVWCSLTNSQGDLLAHNDDRNKERWDCRLEKELSKGRYTLQIEGDKPGTWLFIHQFPIEVAPPPKARTSGSQATKQPSKTPPAMRKAPIAQIKMHPAFMPRNSAYSVAVHAGKLFRQALFAPADGHYLLTVTGKDSIRWGCQLKHARDLSQRPYSRTRCRFVVYLRKGVTHLRIWRPKTPEQTAPETLFADVQWTRIALNAKTHAATPWAGRDEEGALNPSQVQHWVIRKAWAGVHSTITLQGKGMALLVDEQGKILGFCAATPKARSCAWDVPISQGALHLWLQAAQGPLQYYVKLQEARVPSSQSTVAAGQFYPISALSSRGSLFYRLHASPATQAIVEVLGGRKQCYLFTAGPRYQKGCHQSISLNSTPVPMLVRYTSRPYAMLLYRPNQRQQTLWGDSQAPTASNAPTIPPMGQRVSLQQQGAKDPSVRWLHISLSKASVLHARTRQRNILCTLVSATTKAQIPVRSRFGARGCNISAPLQPGNYWIGVRNVFKRPLQGAIRLSQYAYHTIAQGPHDFLLGSGQTRWFAFASEHNGKIGVGAIGQRDDLHCQIYNQHLQLLANGCQQYPVLPKGNYWLRVSQSVFRPATTLRVILRGLKSPPTAPPQAYLKQMMHTRPQ